MHKLRVHAGKATDETGVEPTSLQHGEGTANAKGGQEDNMEVEEVEGSQRRSSGADEEGGEGRVH